MKITSDWVRDLWHVEFDNVCLSVSGQEAEVHGGIDAYAKELAASYALVGLATLHSIEEPKA